MAGSLTIAVVRLSSGRTVSDTPVILVIIGTAILAFGLVLGLIRGRRIRRRPSRVVPGPSRDTVEETAEEVASIEEELRTAEEERAATDIEAWSEELDRFVEDTRE